MDGDARACARACWWTRPGGAGRLRGRALRDGPRLAPLLAPPRRHGSARRSSSSRSTAARRGARAGWPAPSAFLEDDLVSFGYAGRVLLAAPRRAARPARRCRARADVLVCDFQCLPAPFELSSGRYRPEPTRARARTCTRSSRRPRRTCRPRRRARRARRCSKRAETRRGAASARRCAFGRCGADAPRAPLRRRAPRAPLFLYAPAGPGWCAPVRAGAATPPRCASRSAGEALPGSDRAEPRCSRRAGRSRSFRRAPAGRDRRCRISCRAAGRRRATPPSLAGAPALLFGFLGGLVLNLMPCVLPVLAIKLVALAELVAAAAAARCSAHAAAYTAGILADAARARRAAWWRCAPRAPRSAGASSSRSRSSWRRSPRCSSRSPPTCSAPSRSSSRRDAARRASAPTRRGAARSFFDGLLAVRARHAVLGAVPRHRGRLRVREPGAGDRRDLPRDRARPRGAVRRGRRCARARAPDAAPRRVDGRAARARSASRCCSPSCGCSGSSGRAGGPDAMARPAGAAARDRRRRAGCSGSCSARAGTRSARGVLLGAVAALAAGRPRPRRAATRRRADAPATAARAPYARAALRGGARAPGAPVFVYFTADWCITCKLNERRVLAHAAGARGARAPRLRPCSAPTGRGATRRSASELARLGKAGVPVYALYAAGGPRRPRLLPELLRLDAASSTRWPRPPMRRTGRGAGLPVDAVTPLTSGPRGPRCEQLETGARCMSAIRPLVAGAPLRGRLLCVLALAAPPARSSRATARPTFSRARASTAGAALARRTTAARSSTSTSGRRGARRARSSLPALDAFRKEFPAERLRGARGERRRDPAGGATFLSRRPVGYPARRRTRRASCRCASASRRCRPRS